MNRNECKRKIYCVIGCIENEKVLQYIFTIVSNIANEIELYEKYSNDTCDDSAVLSS